MASSKLIILFSEIFFWGKKNFKAKQNLVKVKKKKKKLEILFGGEYFIFFCWNGMFKIEIIIQQHFWNVVELPMLLLIITLVGN